MSKWRYLYRLIRLNWILAGMAYVIVVGVRLTLWGVPFRYVHQFFSRFSPDAPPSAATRGRRQRIAAAVSIVSPFMPKASCLTQALATQALLHLKGEAARLHYGVTRDADGRFKAHAWLECNGELLIGDLPDLGRFRPLGDKRQVLDPK